MSWVWYTGNSYLHLAINSIPTADATSTTAAHIVITPASTTLAVGTITSHVACVTTDTADDASSVVLSLRAVVLAVANLATVLASLVLVISEGTVECGEFSELVALELVLAFRNRSSLGMLARATV